MRAWERQKAYSDAQIEKDRIAEAAYQLFMSEWKPGMSSWQNQHARVRQSYYDRVTTPACLSCDAPAVDSGEGRFCVQCQDHEGTCVNDHCLTCGATT